MVFQRYCVLSLWYGMLVWKVKLKVYSVSGFEWEQGMNDFFQSVLKLILVL